MLKAEPWAVLLLQNHCHPRKTPTLTPLQSVTSLLQRVCNAPPPWRQRKFPIEDAFNQIAHNLRKTNKRLSPDLICVSKTAGPLRISLACTLGPLEERVLWNKTKERGELRRVKACPALPHDAAHSSDAFKWIGSILEPLFAEELALSSIIVSWGVFK